MADTVIVCSELCGVGRGATMTTAMTQASINLDVFFYRPNQFSWVKRCIQSHFLVLPSIFCR